MLSTFYFSPLSGGVSRKYMKQEKGDAKAGIVHHCNKKDMKSPRGMIPGLLQIQEAEVPPHVYGLGIDLQKLEGELMG